MNFIRSLFNRRISKEELFKNQANYDSTVSFGWSGSVSNFPRKKTLINIGKHCLINGELIINPYGGNIQIGNYCYIGHNTRIQSDTSIIIGNDVQISYNVSIIDNNAHEIDNAQRVKTARKILLDGFENLKDRGDIKGEQIIIEDEVWINLNCIILKGVKIGKGAIIGAGSLVTNDIPPYSLAVGNPAKVIKKI